MYKWGLQVIPFEHNQMYMLLPNPTPQPPLQLHENLLKRKINLHVQAKALISFAMHDWFLVVSYFML